MSSPFGPAAQYRVWPSRLNSSLTFVVAVQVPLFTLGTRTIGRLPRLQSRSHISASPLLSTSPVLRLHPMRPVEMNLSSGNFVPDGSELTICSQSESPSRSMSGVPTSGRLDLIWPTTGDSA